MTDMTLTVYIYNYPITSEDAEKIEDLLANALTQAGYNGHINDWFTGNETSFPIEKERCCGKCGNTDIVILPKKGLCYCPQCEVIQDIDEE